MKRLLSTLAILAALLAVAIPAQASTGLGHRYHLGHQISVAEIDSFGCAGATTVRSYLLEHDGRWVVAPKGTVKHPNRIVLACSFLHPHAAPVEPPVMDVPPPPQPVAQHCDVWDPVDPSKCTHMSPDAA